ncbi:polysaccharide lyase family 8 super-sandwich domain-containing protein [Pedobacter frigoris]|uniref:Chondroitin AC lyase n=1 Tax=Pedobacter frigoris TaxID=2571272 RepID=A0A4U1CFB8_9SPHI|nr:polysaccharide lyase family 8 super-sandwich domain-containing protein [Pedobacter frigoris]TKC05153.1 hypothetical protein FA047_15450 [Pedobacter frigoris]
MSKRYPAFYILLLLTTKAIAQVNTDFEMVTARCKQLVFSDTAYANEQSLQLTYEMDTRLNPKTILNSIEEEGCWEEIDYASKQRSKWETSWHLYRVMSLCKAWKKNNDNNYLQAIHKSLNYWITKDFLCNNWWHNQINVPYIYSNIMLVLGDAANAEEKEFFNKKMISRVAMQKYAIGQNKIWKHDIEARIALVQQNPEAFNEAIQNMQTVIVSSTREGIQPDYSFQQHGTMLQFGNYGIHYTNSLLFWLSVTAKTKYAFEPAKQKILFDYISNGLRWSVYNGAMDITAIGRQLRDQAEQKRASNLNDNYNLLRKLGTDSLWRFAVDGFASASQLSRNPLIGNKSFWRSDYMINLSEGKYQLSVKTHGPFSTKVESINSENLKGAFLNDGITMIRYTGKEYLNIAPLWNWTMLPGSTLDTTMNPASNQIFETNNKSDFVGQLSDGNAGFSAMDYNRLGVHAHKSYFFIKNMMIALGAGIQADTIQHVVTTIDQKLNKGKLLQSKNNKAWWSGGVGYKLLDLKNIVKTRIQSRKGDWGDIDAASKGELVKASVLSIFMSHKQNDTYAYLAQTGVSAKQFNTFTSQSTVKVVKNTTDVQAIQSENLIMVVFYKAGHLKSDQYEIAVDKPCMVMVSRTGGKPVAWISDPTRKAQLINLKYGKQNAEISLPSGMYAGSAAKHNFAD